MDKRRWSIGEMSDRSGLTPRALRLYDERGLLVPANVDAVTGYRLYDEAQLPDAVLIATLRRAGMPLARVADVLGADRPAAHALIERWWAAAVAEHDATAALIPQLHHYLDEQDHHMTDATVPAIDDGALRIALDAIHRGDANAVGDALAATPALLTARIETGGTLLGAAASAITDDHNHPGDNDSDGRVAIVCQLLDAGADPSAADARGWTPLHSAAIGGNLPLTQALVDAGADGGVGAHGVASATPLAFTLFYGHVECARILVGAHNGRTPDDLRIAAALGELDRIDALIGEAGPLSSASRGFDFAGPPQWFPSRVTAVDDQGVLDEALSWAARAGQIESMALLARVGANVNSNPYRGTPLLWAVFNDHLEAAAWLLDHGADPDLRHDFGGRDHGIGATALHLAAQYSRLQCLDLLLERGADATVVDELHGGTPLGWARFGEAADSVQILEAHLGSRT